MVGFCGIVGDSTAGIDPLSAALPRSAGERSVEFCEDGLAVHIASHPQFHEDQPATTENGSLVWVYGDPYGFDGSDEYDPRTDYSMSNAEYCAHLFDQHGIEFVADLNGEFSGLVFNRQNGEARLFTDRIGSYPLFYSRTDTALLFSSRIQSIGLHPDFSPSFDRGYLTEFFSVQKAFGTATPLVDVQKMSPASVLSVGLDGSGVNHRTYWRPRYRPRDRSPAKLAEVIADTFFEVFEERIRDDLEYGVLLSGGSDSRLILGILGELGRSPTAFHMANWKSREARTAAQVAQTAGVDFRLLKRGPDYHERLLEVVPQFSNFVGAFDESIATGFADELASVDVVLTGYLGDTTFGDYPMHVPRATRLIHPGYEQRVGSVSEFVERYLGRYPTPVKRPDFLDAPEISTVLNENIHSENGTVSYHGVVYPSLRELQLCEYYPLTNQFASANTDSVRQITGHWSPFFDNRLIDLSLSIPVKDRIRYDPINHALSQLFPRMAAIPHSATGIPLDESIRTGRRYHLQKEAMKLTHRFTDDQPPAPYLGHGPWMNESELIRSHGFVEEAIARNEDLIATLPFLDSAGVRECYRDHLDGADHWRSLYTLITLLETPVAERVGAGYR
jgi:asparagine synthase (glutamine-hydrolysing)